MLIIKKLLLKKRTLLYLFVGACCPLQVWLWHFLLQPKKDKSHNSSKQCGPEGFQSVGVKRWPVSLRGGRQPRQGGELPGLRLPVTGTSGSDGLMLVGPAAHNPLCPMWTLVHFLKWMSDDLVQTTTTLPFGPVKTAGPHRRDARRSPVWAATCVQPLHAPATFSPPSSERFTGVGVDRKASVAVSWPRLLLPHRNKSPSPAHQAGWTSFNARERQQ